MVARHRTDQAVFLYVGKTGDNRAGCNPVVSRAGNHFSFNKIHSQMRNKLPVPPEECDFDFFYAAFDPYVDAPESRERIDVVNEMERRLNALCQEAFGDMVINPHRGAAWVAPRERARREEVATLQRVGQLQDLVRHVKEFLEGGRP